MRNFLDFDGWGKERWPPKLVHPGSRKITHFVFYGTSVGYLGGVVVTDPEDGRFVFGSGHGPESEVREYRGGVGFCAWGGGAEEFECFVGITRFYDLGGLWLVVEDHRPIGGGDLSDEMGVGAPAFRTDGCKGGRHLERSRLDGAAEEIGVLEWAVDSETFGDPDGLPFSNLFAGGDGFAGNGELVAFESSQVNEGREGIAKVEMGVKGAVVG